MLLADCRTRQHWRETASSSKATRYDRQRLLSTLLGKWSARTYDISALAVQADDYLHRNDEIIKWNVLDTWRRVAALGRAERQFMEKLQVARVETAWSTWTERV